MPASRKAGHARPGDAHRMEENMLSFESDYTEGAHEAILRRLAETNLEQWPGYGGDFYSERRKSGRPVAAHKPRFFSL